MTFRHACQIKIKGSETACKQFLELVKTQEGMLEKGQGNILKVKLHFSRMIYSTG
jgi:hypothetical protein